MRYLNYSPQFKHSFAALLLCSGLGLLSHNTQAQTQTPPDTASPFRLLPNYGADKAYSYVERMPVLKNGGHEGLSTLIRKNQVPLPAGAKVLLMSFVVDKNGKPTQAKLNTIPSGVNIPTSTYQKAAHLLKSMDFVPGQTGGRPVNVSFAVPLARSK